MGMTMSQKILAAHAGLASVKAGQLINAELDMVLGNDITSPVAVKEFEKAGFSCIKCPERVSMVMDHFTPNKDIKAAEQVKTVRTFANKYGVENFFDVGRMGIEHALLPEQGLVGAGDLVIGADSHTCTYGALGAFSTGVGSTDMAAGMMSGQCWFKVPSAIKFVLKNKPAKYICGKDIILHIIGLIGVDGALYKSMEFVGDGIRYLSIDDRFTICNMAIEAGAKNGIFPVDDVTREYLNGRFKREIRVFEADADAEYERTIEVDLSKLEPTVAFPHLPENTRTPEAWGDVKIDQVVIGSCTNGHITDLRIAADILRGKKVADQHHLEAGDARGAVRRVHRRGRGGFHPDLRALPGRAHGHFGGGRARCRHDQPQLRRAHGACGQRSVPRFPLRCGGERNRRQNRNA